jgi:type II secretory pathway pseudopilin PulG
MLKGRVPHHLREVRDGAPAARRAAHGFSVVELLISMGLFLVVTGAIFEQLMVMQKKAASESMKTDMSQQAREFVDEMVRDLHMAGYPKAAMYSAPLDNTSPLVAAGLVSVSPTQIILEGDVNSEGQVYSVNISYLANVPGDFMCPCIRRSAVPKMAGSPLMQPVSPNFTETQSVFPPGTGPGQSGEDLFAFYDQNGNQIDVSAGADISTPGGQAIISSIQTVKINLNLLTSLRDPSSGDQVRTSLSATARLSQ